MKRIRTLGVLAAIILITLTACSAPKAEPEATIDAVEEIALTLDELAAFNGLNGNAAYIAVNGIIYDVTHSSRWKDGVHNGFEAGKDLTDNIINDSPHGLRTLDNVPKIGILIDN